jgi:hypothetical protein
VRWELGEFVVCACCADFGGEVVFFEGDEGWHGGLSVVVGDGDEWRGSLVLKYSKNGIEAVQLQYIEVRCS